MFYFHLKCGSTKGYIYGCKNQTLLSGALVTTSWRDSQKWEGSEPVFWLAGCFLIEQKYSKFKGKFSEEANPARLVGDQVSGPVESEYRLYRLNFSVDWHCDTFPGLTENLTPKCGNTIWDLYQPKLYFFPGREEKGYMQLTIYYCKRVQFNDGIYFGQFSNIEACAGEQEIRIVNPKRGWEIEMRGWETYKNDRGGAEE